MEGDIDSVGRGVGRKKERLGVPGNIDEGGILPDQVEGRVVSGGPNIEGNIGQFFEGNCTNERTILKDMVNCFVVGIFSLLYVGP